VRAVNGGLEQARRARARREPGPARAGQDCSSGGGGAPSLALGCGDGALHSGKRHCARLGALAQRGPGCGGGEVASECGWGRGGLTPAAGAGGRQSRGLRFRIPRPAAPRAGPDRRCPHRKQAARVPEAEGGVHHRVKHLLGLAWVGGGAWGTGARRGGGGEQQPESAGGQRRFLRHILRGAPAARPASRALRSTRAPAPPAARAPPWAPCAPHPRSGPCTRS
jgi:hypothetical protein